MANRVTIDEHFMNPEEVNFDPDISRLNVSQEHVTMFDISFYEEYLHGGYAARYEDENTEENLQLTPAVKHEDSEESLEMEEAMYSVSEDGFKEEEEKEDFKRQKQKFSSQGEESEEEIQPLDSEQFFFDIPAEVLQDREAMISKLKELRKEQSPLRRKNKLLEFWVVKHMAQVRAMQTNQKIIPNDVSMQIEELNIMYRNSLRVYQQDSDRILALRNQLQMEVDNYETRVQEVMNRDEREYQDLLNRLKLIGVGLIFSKTAKKLTEVHINNLIRNQILHREMLIDCRVNYFRLHTRLEDLTKKLKKLELLGTEKTLKDYHFLQNTNITLKEKMDEQISEVDKLRAKIHEVTNKVAYYKEKDIIITENLEEWAEKYDKIKQMSNVQRENVNKLRLEQYNLVRSIQSKQTGLFVDVPQLEGMHQARKKLKYYKDKITILQNNIKNCDKKRRIDVRATSSSLAMSKTKSGLKPGSG